MLEYDGGLTRFFANLALFCASSRVSKNLAKLCLQVVEKSRDRERLKSIPR
jgi:hypothetical protein